MSKSCEPLSDIELAIRLMDNDESALVDILQQYGPVIAAGLRGKYETLTYEDVEDVLSIAVLRLWNARQCYDDNKSKLSTYLYKIADNAAKDVFRLGWQKARQLEVDFGENNDMDAIAFTTDTSQDKGLSKSKKSSPKTKKEHQDLQQVLRGLPEKQKHIIQADAYARDDVADSGKLADELGIARGSVRVERSRAMKVIRRKMQERGHDAP